MKARIHIIALVLVAALVAVAPAALATELRQRIKDCTTDECKAEMAAEAEQIFDKAGERFNEDFSAVGNDIIANHCVSLVQEMLYHMRTLKPYHNYRNVFYLKKLKKLAEQRERLDTGEISREDFERLAGQIQAQFDADVAESQEFVDYKVARLRELADNLSQNVESIKANARISGHGVPDRLKKRVLYLTGDPVWQDFVSETREGVKIRQAILLASNDAGQEVMPQLTAMFNGFDPGAGAADGVFSPAVVDNLAQKYPVK